MKTTGGDMRCLFSYVHVPLAPKMRPSHTGPRSGMTATHTHTPLHAHSGHTRTGPRLGVTALDAALRRLSVRTVAVAPPPSRSQHASPLPPSKKPWTWGVTKGGGGGKGRRHVVAFFVAGVATHPALASAHSPSCRSRSCRWAERAPPRRSAGRTRSKSRP